jgi:hypothetical protein
MKKVNKYIQYILLATIPVCLVGSIMEPSLLVWLLFLALTIGVTHYLGSLIDLFINGTQSIYRYHLLASTLVLGIIATTTDVGVFRVDGLLEDVATFIGFGGSFALAIYFWVLTFGKSTIVLEQEHNVYDL